MRRGLSGGVTAIVFTLFVSLGIILSCGATTFADGDIEINETNFPDSKFRQYVLDNFDTVKDEKLTSSEISAVTTIDISSRYFSDLKGIEFFSELKELWCPSNSLVSLNLSKNKKLEKVSCHWNELTSLNVSGLSSLTQLNCMGNQLTKLDISGCTSLVEFCCLDNQISSLNLKNNTKLEILECQENNLSELNLTKNTALKRVECTTNQIKSINLSKNTALQELDIGYNPLTDLDLRMNTVLTDLNISSTGLTAIDLSNNARLIKLNLFSCKFQKIDLSHNPALERLDCDRNQFTSLDVSNNKKLKTLNCGYNQLTGLDLSANKDIERLGCENNSITTLNLSMNKKLIALSCENNRIDKVYLTNTKVNVNYDSSTELVFLTSSDWQFKGFSWKGNNSDGYEEAYVDYVCTNEKGKGLKNRIKVDINSMIITQPTCDEKGETSYLAGISADDALDGQERNSEKKADLPAPLGHLWLDWKVTKKPTVSSDGEETRVCKHDPSHKQTRPIPHLTPTPGSSKVALSLDKKTADVICGKTLTLKATLKGSKTKISWKSSDTNIATVDSNGKITAKQAGSVTITASAAGKSAKCVVQVLFKDVTNSKDFWYAPTYYLVNGGVVKGYDKQTKFKPANECTRAQMVTFIWRLKGEPAPKIKTCKFKDVKKTDYFYKACIWGNENHIVEGYKDGTFGPQIVCARKHAVTFLWRFAGQPDPKSKANKFKDVKKSDYFYKATLWASEQGILAGYKDGTFKPNGDCLRRQMVTFLYKYDKFVNGKG